MAGSPVRRQRASGCCAERRPQCTPARRAPPPCTPATAARDSADRAPCSTWHLARSPCERRSSRRSPPGILDPTNKALRFGIIAQAHANRPPSRGVLQRIVQQIEDDLLQAGPIAVEAGAPTSGGHT